MKLHGSTTAFLYIVAATISAAAKAQTRVYDDCGCTCDCDGSYCSLMSSFTCGTVSSLFSINPGRHCSAVGDAMNNLTGENSMTNCEGIFWIVPPESSSTLQDDNPGIGSPTSEDTELGNGNLRSRNLADLSSSALHDHHGPSSP